MRDKKKSIRKLRFAPTAFYRNRWFNFSETTNPIRERRSSRAVSWPPRMPRRRACEGRVLRPASNRSRPVGDSWTRPPAAYTSTAITAQQLFSESNFYHRLSPNVASKIATKILIDHCEQKWSSNCHHIVIVYFNKHRLVNEYRIKSDIRRVCPRFNTLPSPSLHSIFLLLI